MGGLALLSIALKFHDNQSGEGCGASRGGIYVRYPHNERNIVSSRPMILVAYGRGEPEIWRQASS